MTSSARLHRALLVGLLVALVGGCADFERGKPTADSGVTGPGPAGDGGTTGGGEAVSFESTVHPLLISGCESCHRANGSAGDTGLVLAGDAATDFGEATALIDTSNPAGSRLLRKAAGAGHGGGAIFAEGSPEYQALLDWISGGAQP